MNKFSISTPQKATAALLLWLLSFEICWAGNTIALDSAKNILLEAGQRVGAISDSVIAQFACDNHFKGNSNHA